MSVGSIINNKNNENNSINNIFRIVANAFDINSKTEINGDVLNYSDDGFYYGFKIPKEKFSIPINSTTKKETIMNEFLKISDSCDIREFINDENTAKNSSDETFQKLKEDFKIYTDWKEKPFGVDEQFDMYKIKTTYKGKEMNMIKQRCINLKGYGKEGDENYIYI